MPRLRYFTQTNKNKNAHTQSTNILRIFPRATDAATPANPIHVTLTVFFLALSFVFFKSPGLRFHRRKGRRVYSHRPAFVSKNDPEVFRTLQSGAISFPCFNTVLNCIGLKSNRVKGIKVCHRSLFHALTYILSYCITSIDQVFIKVM